ncbi:cation transporter [Candidatus Poribacteria bacterium]|nr:cation transporter [Candidatus Poribacteria bacterium]
MSRFVTFVFLYPTWLLLSGYYDFFHLSLGVLCCALVAFLSHDLLFENIMDKNRAIIITRFLSYLPWLIYQIVLANFHVVYLVLNPKMPIEPKIIRFKTKLKSDISKVTLANSITLTPGTITMDIIDGEFYVHAIDEKSASDLLTGEMEERVADIYLEEENSPK